MSDRYRKEELRRVKFNSREESAAQLCAAHPPGARSAALVRGQILPRVRTGRVRFLTLLVASVFASSAFAHSVPQIEATKFLAPETVQLLSDRITLGSPGFQVGDTVSYIIDFSPIPNGATVGPGAVLALLFSAALAPSPRSIGPVK